MIQNTFKNVNSAHYYTINNMPNYPNNLFEKLEVDFNQNDDNIMGFDYICKTILLESEYNVIILRYKNKKTFKDIGNMLNMSRQRAQQVEISALNKIYKEIHKPNFTYSYTKIVLNDKINKLFKEEAHYLRGAIKYNKLPYVIKTKNLNSNEFLLLSDKLSKYESSLNYNISVLNLSPRVINKLYKANFLFIKDFIGMSFEDIISITCISKNAKYNLIYELKKYDIIIGVDFYEEW